MDGPRQRNRVNYAATGTPEDGKKKGSKRGGAAAAAAAAARGIQSDSDFDGGNGSSSDNESVEMLAGKGKRAKGEKKDKVGGGLEVVASRSSLFHGHHTTST